MKPRRSLCQDSLCPDWNSNRELHEKVKSITALASLLGPKRLSLAKVISSLSLPVFREQNDQTAGEECGEYAGGRSVKSPKDMWKWAIREPSYNVLSINKEFPTFYGKVHYRVNNGP